MSQQSQTIMPILERVEKITGVRPDEVVSDLRTRRICHARYLTIISVRRTFPEWALQDIASAVGHSSHQSAAFALKMAEDLIQTSDRFSDAVRRITEQEVAP